MGEWISLPDGPSIPKWLSNPAKIEDKVLGWVVDWFVNGVWKGVQTLTGWILDLYRVAIEQPVTAAGSSVVDAAGPVGDAAINLAWSLSSPLRALAQSGPFGFILVAFASGVVLVTIAYLAKAAWVAVSTAKGVSPW